MRVTAPLIDCLPALLFLAAFFMIVGCQTPCRRTVGPSPDPTELTVDRVDQSSVSPPVQLVGHTDYETVPDVAAATPLTANSVANSIQGNSIQGNSIQGNSTQHSNRKPATDELFATLDELDISTLVHLVEQRNSSLQAMYASWQAAAARYPQEIALDDPMLDVMMAPASFAGNSNVQSSWAVQGSQKFSWRGKRNARGQMASRNAQAAAHDVEDTRLQLALAARMAFSDYLLAQRSRDLNSSEIRLLTELKSVALTRYETNQTPQQDVLQAEVDLAEAQRRGVEAARAHRVAVARINTLLQRGVTAPLPPPSETDAMAERLPHDDDLVARALRQRPDLSARSARIAAEQAAYCLALREFYPDIEIYGRYDRFWIDREQQGSLGVKMNLPVQRNRRRAAVEEAVAKISRMRAEYKSEMAQVQFEVQAVSARLQESKRITELYSTQILKAAEQNVASARVGYESGSVSFLTVVSAQRQLIEARQRMIEAQVEYQRQMAELERTIGAPLGVEAPT